MLHFARLTLAFQRGLFGLIGKKRGAMEYIKSTISLATKSTHILGKPVIITIEPTTFCNLDCPVCETGNNTLGRTKQNMTFEQFKIVIDKIASHCNTLIFYFMGEPFANPASYDMIKYAKSRGIPFITTCTNGDLVNPEKLINSGIDEVSFQIGGITKETHSRYRINSNLERVLKNLAQTVKLKKERNTKIHIVCGFILMRHNENEVIAFKNKMKELGVDEAVVIDPCVRTIEQAHEMLPTDTAHWLYDPIALNEGILRPKIVPKNECPWLYYSLTIQVSGNVVPCCRDARGNYIMGNILEQDLMEIWNGEKFKKFRNMINTNQNKINLCKLCSGYGLGLIR